MKVMSEKILQIFYGLKKYYAGNTLTHIKN
jgi:hypothetical protein